MGVTDIKIITKYFPSKFAGVRLLQSTALEEAAIVLSKKTQEEAYFLSIAQREKCLRVLTRSGTS